MLIRTSQDGCPLGDPWTNEKRNNTTSVSIQVLDVDDLPPEFTNSNYDFNVDENNLAQILTDVSAADQDSFKTDVEYTFTGYELSL